MAVEEVSPDQVRKGSRIVDRWSGTLVTVKKVRKDGETFVFEIGAAFCLEVRCERGSVVYLERRRGASKKGKAKE